MPAHFLSSMSVIFTRTMEQAFSTPSMTDYGLADPLLTMAAINDTMSDVMRIPPSDPKSNLRLSSANFLHQCLAKDLAANAVTKYNLMNETGMESIRRPNKIRTVLIYDGLSHRDVADDLDGYPKDQKISVYYCENALTAIENMIGKSTPEINKQIMRWKKTHNADAKEKGGGADLTQQINDFTSIYHLSDISNKELITKLYFLPLLKDIDRQVGALTFQSVVGRSAATRQQAFQWAAGGSSFLTWMWNMMPIIQGLIYAIAPFMAFALGLGIFGVRMIMKYFMIILWTQSWLPLAAIINYFIVSQMDATASVITFSGVSFLALNDLLTETNKNLALAGNLMSMIPMLSMFILTGSSIAFSKLASGAAASSPSETKPVAPEVSNGPSLMMISPPQTMSRNEASGYSGAVLETYNLSSIVQNTKQSLDAQQKQANLTMSGLRQKLAMQTWNFQHNTGSGTKSTDGIQLNDQQTTRANTGNSTSVATANSQGVNNANATNIHNETLGTFFAGLSAGGQGSLTTSNPGKNPAGKGGSEKEASLSGGGNIGGSYAISGGKGESNTGTITEGQIQTTTSTKTADGGGGSTVTLTKPQGVVTDKQIADAGARGDLGQDGVNFARAYAIAQSATQSYSEMDSVSKTVSSSVNLTDKNVAQMLYDNGYKDISSYVKPESMSQQEWDSRVAYEENRLRSQGFSQDSAKLAAGFAAAMHSGDGISMAKALGTIGYGLNGVNPGAESRHNGVVPKNFMKNTEKQVRSAEADASRHIDVTKGKINTLENETKKGMLTPEQVQGLYDAKTPVVQNTAEQNQTEVGREAQAIQNAQTVLKNIYTGQNPGVVKGGGEFIVSTLWPDLYKQGGQEAKDMMFAIDYGIVAAGGLTDTPGSKVPASQTEMFNQMRNPGYNNMVQGKMTSLDSSYQMATHSGDTPMTDTFNHRFDQYSGADNYANILKTGNALNQSAREKAGGK